MEVTQKNIKGYEIKERIGTGGFGAVYRAYQSTVGREVAVKVIIPSLSSKPDFIRRFEGEAQVVARLEHPHITPLYDFWRDADGAYLVMRWLRGGSLREVLDQGPLELHAAVTLIQQIAGALSLAHRNGIIHRDIKPGNILLDEDGNAYLTDFGIAKDLNLPGSGTQTDAIVGSLDYISPEQARSQPVTARTDIYSLGVTLYEIITGKHPFEGLSSVERLYKHINDPLPDIEGLDPAIQDAVNRVIQKATQKNPEHRYADALAMAAEFREAVGLNRASTTMEELLTQREHQILALIIEGLSNKEIANRLTVALSTVKWYVTQIYDKLGVRSRVQAIVRARDLNLISKGNDEVEPVPVATEDFFPENPYKGLRAFQSGDHQDYFGREKVIGKLLKRMGETSEYQRFLAIVGPSGSGKSSLVKAGLIPALWRGDVPGSEKWFIVEMLPGERPLDELEIALTKVAANQATNLHEHLLRDQYGLGRIANLILPNDQSEMVLFIDQFEEVFTLVEDEATRVHFLDLLTTAVIDRRSRIRVVITMRADFYDRPLHYPQFGEMVRNRLETIMPLSAEELESAIRRPAERVGVTFEQGLVASIISDVNYQPGALPLLQYALTELFEGRQGRLLTREVYETIGRATGALAKRAEEIYQGLDKSDQELTRQVFLRLVTLGEGTEDTRRRTPRAELFGITRESDVLEELLETFTGYRLLSLDTDPGTRQPTVEVAHEALIREWDRLKLWLNDSREEIKLQRQLASMSEEWRASGHDPSFLARGSRLDQFEQWVVQTELTLTADEKRYFEASTTQHAHEVQTELERQAREQSLEKRAQTVLRALVAVFAIAALLSSGLTLFAFSQRDTALQAQAQIATEQANTLQALDLAQRSGLALVAGDAIDQNEIDLAVALAFASVGDSSSNMLPETTRVLERLENLGGPVFLGNLPHSCGAFSSRYGQYFVRTSCNEGQYSMSIWDTVVLEEVALIHLDTDVGFGGFSSDFSRMLTWLLPTNVSLDGAIVQIWDTSSWQIIHEYTIDIPIFLDIRISSDADYFFTMEFSPLSDMENRVYFASSVNMYRATNGELIRTFTAENMGIQSYDFSDDGKMVAIGGWSGFEGPYVDLYRAVVFDSGTGEVLHTFDRPHSDQIPVNGYTGAQIGFTDHDTKLYISGYPNYFIDLETGIDDPRGAAIVNGRIFERPSFDFETVLVFNGESGFIELHSLSDGSSQPIRTTSALYPTFLPNRIITREPGRLDDFLVWDLDPRPSIINQRQTESSITDASYSPDGRYIATVSTGWGTSAHIESITTIYDADTLEEIITLPAVHGESGLGTNVPWGLQWSPDGKILASATFDEGVILWDTVTWQEIRRLTGTLNHVMHIHFVDEGRSILASSGNYFPTLTYDAAPYIIKWDVETGNEIARYNLPPDHVPNHGITFFSLHPDEEFAYVTVNTEQEEDGGQDGFLGYILEFETGEFQLVDQDIVGGLFALDGQYLVKGDLVHKDIRIYAFPSLELVRTVHLLDDFWAYSLSPDGRYLVLGAGTVAFESAVSVYDIQTGQLARRYFGHREQTFIPHISFDPDGERFISTGWDMQMIVWDFDPLPTVDWIRENRLVRDLTCEERQVYRVEPACDPINQQ